MLPVGGGFTPDEIGKLTAAIDTISRNGNVTVLFSESLEELASFNTTNMSTISP